MFSKKVAVKTKKNVFLHFSTWESFSMYFSPPEHDSGCKNYFQRQDFEKSVDKEVKKCFFPEISIFFSIISFNSLFFLSTSFYIWFLDQEVKLGSWSRAEDYANSIIDNLSHWVTGWIDSNMALDLQGGPNWLNRFVDSPIIVNASANAFYKQPTFYVMGHFSTLVE